MEIRPQTSRDCPPIFYSRFHPEKLFSPFSNFIFFSLPRRIDVKRNEKGKLQENIFFSLTTTRVRTLACDTALTLTSNASTILKSSFNRTWRIRNAIFCHLISLQRTNSKEIGDGGGGGSIEATPMRLVSVNGSPSLGTLTFTLNTPSYANYFRVGRCSLKEKRLWPRS